MYMYGSLTLLYSRNWHSSVKQLAIKNKIEYYYQPKKFSYPFLIHALAPPEAMASMIPSLQLCFFYGSNLKMELFSEYYLGSRLFNWVYLYNSSMLRKSIVLSFWLLSSSPLLMYPDFSIIFHADGQVDNFQCVYLYK